MREQDKVALLFEMICETDLASVNRKISEIKMSSEYVRLTEAMVALSGTTSMQDVVERYNKLDVEGITTFERALAVEKEIKELDKKVDFIKNFNPYLALEDNVKDYGIKTVGDINVEISASNQTVDNFTTKEGVTVNHRRKVMAMKAFSWYREAKKSLYIMIENSKLYLSRVRYSKVKFSSLTFQYIVSLLLVLITTGLIFFAPSFLKLRNGSLNGTGILSSVAYYVVLLSFVVVNVIKIHYSNYGYRVASKMRKHIEKQNKTVELLDEASIKFERELMNQVKKPHKVKTLISQIGVLNKENNFSFNEIFEYMYSEKEYYYGKHKALLVISNVFFVIGAICAGIVIALPILITF